MATYKATIKTYPTNIEIYLRSEDGDEQRNVDIDTDGLAGVIDKEDIPTLIENVFETIASKCDIYSDQIENIDDLKLSLETYYGYKVKD